jgi:hypothetical protein
MSRTLLPIWEEYKLTISETLEKKEDPETFEWIQSNYLVKDCEDMRRVLDKVDGSREWLKKYEATEEDHRFLTGLGPKILANLGSWHTNPSATKALWNYKKFLMNWDDSVLKIKTFQAKADYDEKQLTADDIRRFCMLQDIQSGDMATVTLGNDMDTLLTQLIEKFSITYDRSIIPEMFKKLNAQFKEEERKAAEEYDKQEFESRIYLLVHHFKFPSRWNDTKEGSSLFGSIYRITEEMFVEMEKRYPGYRDHIRGIRDMKNSQPR